MEILLIRLFKLAFLLIRCMREVVSLSVYIVLPIMKSILELCDLLSGTGFRPQSHERKNKFKNVSVNNTATEVSGPDTFWFPSFICKMTKNRIETRIKSMTGVSTNSITTNRGSFKLNTAAL